jgi:hypothetical protein
MLLLVHRHFKSLSTHEGIDPTFFAKEFHIFHDNSEADFAFVFLETYFTRSSV